MASATPSGHKRTHSKTDDVAPTPTPLKRRRLDELVGAGSPSTPKALNAIASALNGVAGHSRPGLLALSQNGDSIAVATQSPPTSAQQPPPKPTPSYRPAIKLKALKGTIWDTGEDRKPVLPKKVGPGRPRKIQPPEGTPKPPPKKRGRKPKIKPPEEGLDENAAVDGSPTKSQSVKRAQFASTNGYPNGDRDSTDELSASEVSNRVPGSNRLFDSPRGSPMLRGILTPSKKKGPRAQKSVTFGRDSGGEIFFEDLPKTSRTPKKAAVPAVDEIVCEICSNPDSIAPNQIILCDNCDFAVHQECYEVPEIPEGDWLCKSCAQEDVLKTPKKAVDTETAAAITADIPEIPNLDQHLRSLQRVLLDRCTGRRRIQMSSEQESHEKVHQLIEQTVVAGEGNSMLLIGARGCGKTTLLENIISELKREHHQDFHVVRLNGFIHTDDKLALKDIWRQLGKEMEVEDDLVNRTNYADTMASLLALLSHPSEILGTDEGVTSQSIVFIIDEFDLFASHPRQTLLYNLFDVAQSRKAPIAVLGCTTRLDVVEMLEKRVKSRFSHRYVYMSLPKTLPAYWQVCRQGLIVESDEARKEGIDATLEGYSAFQTYWSHKIEELYKHRAFQDLLQYHYYTTKSASAFFTEWIMPLSSLSPNDVNLTIPPIDADINRLTPPDSQLHLLSSLSDLDLGLLIAAARLDIVAHTDTVNFAMAYDEYSSLMGKQRAQSATSGMLAVGGVRVWSRGVAGISWERLISLGLLVPAGIGGSRNLGHAGLEGKMWKVDVALEEIPAAVKLSTVLARWCREI